ncbi:regulator of chromosome condensation 1/beta-lactamase-inhibitor protein II [Morchella snyderi]|nr:regulator of chromosome condensation 1/beta-lactamase-inhibitor protein II [Morchella snyderi]
MAPVRASKRKADAVEAKKAEEKQTAANTSAPRTNVKDRKIATPKSKTTPRAAKKAVPQKAEKPASQTSQKASKATEKTKAAPAEKAKKPAAEKKGKKTPISPPTSQSQSQLQAESFNTSSSFNEPEVEHEKAHPRKRGKTNTTAPPVINNLPSLKLNVYAFGTGDNSELGLGPEPNAKIVKRPRLNPFLLPEKVGVVAVAIGGMHGLALTHAGQVYSWGVNDQYALGRETKVEAREKNVDESDSDDEEPLNELESTPMLIDSFPEGTVITRIAAGDSISVAVTDTGKVWSWGTFRCADGILGYTNKIRVQPRPALMTSIKNVTELSVGNDHVLAVSSSGSVYAWGNGQQFQLGRRVVERTRLNGLIPREFGLPRKKVKNVATGSYHSFAITNDGKVYAWGLNQFGQCGIYDEQKAGEDATVVPVPTRISSLDQYNIVHVAAGEHHSAAITDDGKLLMWGRLDANQLGIDLTTLPPADVISDISGKPRFLAIPHPIPGRKFKWIGCGTHHNIAIDVDGTAFSWGFGDSYQTGHGPPAVDVPLPTKIENSATKEVEMVFADAGGQFSVLAGIPKPATNGTS